MRTSGPTSSPPPSSEAPSSEGQSSAPPRESIIDRAGKNKSGSVLDNLKEADEKERKQTGFQITSSKERAEKRDGRGLEAVGKRLDFFADTPPETEKSQASETGDPQKGSADKAGDRQSSARDATLAAAASAPKGK
ncbi:MAG: hypothetical protein HQM16_00785 [Deltaproteobacteria bacterium]|nr:hypothetical protein [Deltaproteobacteria bacterium]